MDRSSVRRRIALALTLAIAVLPALGCQTLFLSALYLVKGTDVDPDFAELKGKKVAVVCRPLVTLQYRNATAGRDLAQQVTTAAPATGAQDQNRRPTQGGQVDRREHLGGVSARWAKP